jgi:transcriptional regulator with XRE-family HTH domain
LGLKQHGKVNVVGGDMSLAQRLKQARVEAELTLDQLATEAGVSKTYLWELEHDQAGQKRPSADVLLKIAEALKTTIADLLSLPAVEVNKAKVDLSPSLIEFRDWMNDTKQTLTEDELRDLATMRFRGGQPKSKDDWYDLFRTLKRTTRR